MFDRKPAGPAYWLQQASEVEALAVKLPRFAWIVRRRLKRQAAFCRELARMARPAS